MQCGQAFYLQHTLAVANDSIQTLGTFIASNQDKKWWVLWLFIGGVFLATHSYSWLFSDFVEPFDESGNPIGDGVLMEMLVMEDYLQKVLKRRHKVFISFRLLPLFSYLY